ncbi:universal stress protein [Candidatus Sulfurimonas baltica]|uniref:Universal stress protein n=1 Tax=Candidatus Sulfurimonas baltica TaxID=2740404 RepID=A0A7S7LXB0_9BACT|nr:universal stress protein [Candidatus Sulfurimonas baltica]QOY53183.1 universal stress protein [Candidatus Sulfurimonas baltica]
MKRFKNILCVLESEEDCHPILERAITLAETNQAILTIVTVVPHITVDFNLFKDDPDIDLQTIMENEKKEKLDSLVKSFLHKIKIETRTLSGVPFLEIIYDVLRNGHDLVIKMPEIADWLDHLFGSNDMHLLRKCPCPVWLIKPDSPKSYHNILAAVDLDSDDAEQLEASQKALNLQILQMASSLAVNDFSQLHVVHVWDAPAESLMHSPFIKMTKEEIDDYANRVKDQQEEKLNTFLHDAIDSQVGNMLDYLKPNIHLIKGLASQSIPQLAKKIEADIIVMGTVARTGIPGFIMGNTAETILNQIHCSVLAIKPPEFITPVKLEE